MRFYDFCAFLVFLLLLFGMILSFGKHSVGSFDGNSVLWRSLCWIYLDYLMSTSLCVDGRR